MNGYQEGYQHGKSAALAGKNKNYTGFNKAKGLISGNYYDTYVEGYNDGYKDGMRNR